MIKKSFCGILAGTVLFSSFAFTAASVKAEINLVKGNLASIYDSDNTWSEIDELKSMGLTQNEIDLVLNELPSSGIYLIDGIAYNEQGEILEVNEKGKLSWATKILRSAWDSLPGWVQGALGVTGFEKLLDFIDHFTGTIEDAVYEGCRTLGMNHTTANAVTKILLFIVL